VADADAPRVLRDPGLLDRELTGWIARQVEEAGLDGVVFGLSGGIDSATVCALAARALGPDRCLGLIMPIGSDARDEALARQVGARFGVPTACVPLEPAFDAILAALDGDGRGDGVDPVTDTGGRVVLARANLKPRVRMLALYYHANVRGRMVLGTGNRDEFAVGYFTKHGDGAADAFPLADLLKSEVRALARHLGVPEAVVERPPSAGLWAGQTDESELGITYEQLDRYLLTGTSGDASVDADIQARQRAARHKTTPAPRAALGRDA